MHKALLSLLLVGCVATSGDVYEVCQLDATLLPASAAPGDTVTATGGPFDEEGVRDLRVKVGGIDAAVLSVTRSDTCSRCDTCRLDAQCPACGLCDGRLLDPAERLQCFGDPLADPAVTGSCDECVQSMAFVVPDGVPAGATTVWIASRDGTSDPVPFVVEGPAPTTGETGATP